MLNKDHYLLIGSIVFLIVLYFLSWEVPFFWDATSKSLRASWFFDHDFSQWLVPTEISSGHPPLWELLLAATWKFFGRTIEYSRLLLLIFNIGVYWQLILFIKNHQLKNVPIIVTTLVLIEPTLLAQSTIINNDMMLIFFTILGLNSIYKGHKLFYTVALTGVLFSNLRGIGCFACLLLIDFLFSYFKLKKGKQSLLWVSYILPIVFFSAFLIYHHSILGWVLKVPEHAHRDIASFSQMAKTVGAIIKGFIDHGRVFLFIILSFLLFRLFKTKAWKSVADENKRLIFIFIIFLLVFSALFVTMTNPLGPRYFMINYLVGTLLCLNLIYTLIKNLKWRKISVLVLFIAFITGHFWIWPATISQGWDSSLAYLNYFSLRDDMETFIKENNFKKKEIGTNLNLNNPHYVDLTTPLPPEQQYTNLDTSVNQYILLSNIENETSDEEIRLIMDHWRLIKSFQQLGVFVNLYQNPNDIQNEK